MSDRKQGVSRRSFLFGAAGAAAAAGTAAAQDGGTTTSNGTATSDGGTTTGTSAGGATTTSGNGTATGGNTTAGGNETGGAGGQSAGNETGGNETGGGGGGGGMTKTVEVGAGDAGLKFKPENVEVTPGSTIIWKWVSGGHNVIPEKIPEKSSWEGTPGGESKLFDEGYTYKESFDVTGTYEYFCAPHKSAGMVGSFTVTEDAGSDGGGGGGGGGGPPDVPDSAKSLGVATTFAMVATLGLGYFFIKYGGDYETP